uniref:DUF38 domain-containing protein n=1 Tax=Panagrolaimus sp. JU765 TaxID=591449 RepID=A0AC34R888_9BILA
MIADEIVHNSIPEDRIQFATTCKAFNQLVKDAKPKKIIHHLRIRSRITGVYHCINSGNDRFMTLPALKKFLQQYQVENLSFFVQNRFTDEHLHSELMEILMEPCRFVTDLSILSYYPEFKYVEFYKKLRHLKALTIYDSSGIIMDLPYFPPILVLWREYPLPFLAEKTLNHPLSFLKITREASLTDFQQFLMTANLDIGAEIRFRFGFLEGYLKFIGNGLFEFQMFRAFECFILDQEMNIQNKKILKLSADLYFGDENVPFTVTSVSNPDIVISSGELTYESPKKIISENVVECVKVMNPDYSIRYSRLIG